MILLSHTLDEHTPMYGNGPGFVRETQKKIQSGDSCNSSVFHFPNHIGTHIDLPFHFCQQGLTLSDYPPEFWLCSEVQVLRSLLQPTELCSATHLERAYNEAPVKNPKANIVLLYTGWCEKRSTEAYWQTPPGYLPEVSGWIKNKFSQINFFGFDTISLTSFAHRDVGREAHRAMLCQDKPIVIIEDMALELLKNCDSLSRVLVSPLFISKADGAPCTVWAES